MWITSSLLKTASIFSPSKRIWFLPGSSTVVCMQACLSTWTVDDYDNMNLYLKENVSGLISDYPDVAKLAVQDYWGRYSLRLLPMAEGMDRVLTFQPTCTFCPRQKMWRLYNLSGTEALAG